MWILSAALAIVANVSFGTSIVALNAYLPGLARETAEAQEAWVNAEKIREAAQNEQNGFMEEDELIEGDARDYDVEREPLAQVSPQYKAALDNYHKTLARATSHISSLGIALGYASGIALLLVILIPVILLKSSTFALRLAIGMSGAWWAVFTIPAALWLPGGRALGTEENSDGIRSTFRNGPPENGDDTAIFQGAVLSDEEKSWSFYREVVGAWKRLGQMLHPREMRKLRYTFWYLLAWFLLSDGMRPPNSNPPIHHTLIIYLRAVLLFKVSRQSRLQRSCLQKRLFTCQHHR